MTEFMHTSLGALSKCIEGWILYLDAFENRVMSMKGKYAYTGLDCSLPIHPTPRGFVTWEQVIHGNP
jgi:hypothetical protein